MQLLKDQLSGQVLDQLSQQVGANPNQTAEAANGIFAGLLGGLAKNASSPQGLQALMGALDKDHDGSIMDDLLGMVSGTAQPQNANALNGAGILGHILGGQQQQVAQHVSQSSGLNMQQVMRLMPILAPIVMGMVGKMRNQGAQAQGGVPAAQNGIGMNDLASVLMGAARGASQQNGMGDLVGAVLGQVMGGAAQQKGAGGLFGKILGGLFKR